MCFACSNICKGAESILSVFLLYLTALLTVMLPEREIRCNTPSTMGNISSDMKEFLHLNAAFKLGTLCSSVPWSGICFTCVLGIWHHLMEKWSHVKAAGGKGCFQRLLLEGEPLGRVFFTCSSLGSFRAGLGPFCSSTIQSSHEVLAASPRSRACRHAHYQKPGHANLIHLDI